MLCASNLKANDSTPIRKDMLYPRVVRNQDLVLPTFGECNVGWVGGYLVLLRGKKNCRNTARGKFVKDPRISPNGPLSIATLENALNLI